MLCHQLAMHIGHVHIEVAREHSVNGRCGDPCILYSGASCLECQTECAHATQPPYPALADPNDGYWCHVPPPPYVGERSVSGSGLSYSSRPRSMARVPVNPPRTSIVRRAVSERPRTFRKSAHETIAA